jgi:flagellar basal body rod protein FlgB
MNSILEKAKNAMSYHNQRSGVIASNITRANMEGEKAFDLSPLSNNFKKNLQLTTTTEKHLRGKNETPGGFKAEKTKNPYETTINGNNIDLVEQTKLLSDAAMDNKIAVEIYAKNAKLLNVASK